MFVIIGISMFFSLISALFISFNSYRINDNDNDNDGLGAVFVSILPRKREKGVIMSMITLLAKQKKNINV